MRGLKLVVLPDVVTVADDECEVVVVVVMSALLVVAVAGVVDDTLDGVISISAQFLVSEEKISDEFLGSIR